MPDFRLLWSDMPGGGVIEYEGRQLRLSYWLSVLKGDRLHILFERQTARPVQGLALQLHDRRGELEIASKRSKHMVLWTDTAPRHVECSINKVKRGGQLSLMNVWRDEKYGTTMMGLNCAAMDVQLQPDGSVLLCCSDGWGMDPDFSDLVVRVIVEHDAAAGGSPRAAV
jgi:hypothetical protein